MAIIEMKAVLACVKGLVYYILFFNAKCSVLIANFEFKPAFAGQVAKPAAAITMSEQENVSLY